jgi:hypothetical protein
MKTNDIIKDIEAKRPKYKKLCVYRRKYKSIFDFMGETTVYAVGTPDRKIIKKCITRQEAIDICKKNDEAVLKFYGRSFTKPI